MSHRRYLLWANEEGKLPEKRKVGFVQDAKCVSVKRVFDWKWKGCVEVNQTPTQRQSRLRLSVSCVGWTLTAFYVIITNNGNNQKNKQQQKKNFVLLTQKCWEWFWSAPVDPHLKMRKEQGLTLISLSTIRTHQQAPFLQHIYSFKLFACGLTVNEHWMNR